MNTLTIVLCVVGVLIVSACLFAFRNAKKQVAIEDNVESVQRKLMLHATIEQARIIQITTETALFSLRQLRPVRVQMVRFAHSHSAEAATVILYGNALVSTLKLMPEEDRKSAVRLTDYILTVNSFFELAEKENVLPSSGLFNMKADIISAFPIEVSDLLGPNSELMKRVGI